MRRTGKAKGRLLWYYTDDIVHTIANCVDGDSMFILSTQLPIVWKMVISSTQLAIRPSILCPNIDVGSPKTDVDIIIHAIGILARLRIKIGVFLHCTSTTATSSTAIPVFLPLSGKECVVFHDPVQNGRRVSEDQPRPRQIRGRTGRPVQNPRQPRGLSGQPRFSRRGFLRPLVGTRWNKLGKERRQPPLRHGIDVHNGASTLRPGASAR